MVTWEGAVAYTEWLAEKTGDPYRLPTEAEWEYAARDGGVSQTKFSGSNNLGEVAWYRKNSDSRSHAIGAKAKNEIGAYDMSGNVWEWCSDWYKESYYHSFAKGGAKNPKGPSVGSGRVARGGSFDKYDIDCRSAARGGSLTDNQYDIGFRLARDEYRASKK